MPTFDLRSPHSIDGNSGNWAAGDGYIDLFLAEFVPARLLHLQCQFQSNSITSVDSLTTDTDYLSYLIDCAINDMGTPGNPADDEVWVLDDPAGESVRLLQYKAGAAGIQQEISLSIPPGESTVPVPTSMTFGRALGYGDTRELYVLLKDGVLL